MIGSAGLGLATSEQIGSFYGEELMFDGLGVEGVNIGASDVFDDIFAFEAGPVFSFLDGFFI